MKTLLVSGCSVTHGAELYNGFTHPENIKRSFSQVLADRLGCELVNVAQSAASNEYIFHSVMSKLSELNNIHSVLVVWTTPDRLSWTNQGRYYFVLGNFATSMCDLVNFEMHNLSRDGCWFTGDNPSIVQQLADAHKFFVSHYFDHKRDLQKLRHYDAALRSLCQSRGLPYIGLDWKDIDISTWRAESRHPNLQEHRDIADHIFERYYHGDTFS